MQSSKDVLPNTDSPNPAQEVTESDLDVVRGGAWSLCLNDPSIRDLTGDANPPDVSPELPAETPATVGKSKLLHK